MKFMFNYKMVIQYDGTDFCGWQIQKEQRSVQGEITNALNILLKKEISITGAGRTDAGVHAWGQAANFLYEEELDLYRFRYSLNSILPKEIVVREMNKIEQNFNARFSATSRSYFYIITNHRSPFWDKFSHQLYRALDLNFLNRLSQLLIGKKDFSCFSKNISEQEKTICEIKEARWKRQGEMIFFFIEADRFLHGMARAITGTLLQLHDDKNAAGKLKNIIELKERSEAGISVPAKGLFLFKVRY